MKRWQYAVLEFMAQLGLWVIGSDGVNGNTVRFWAFVICMVSYGLLNYREGILVGHRNREDVPNSDRFAASVIELVKEGYDDFIVAYEKKDGEAGKVRVQLTAFEERLREEL